MKGKIINKGVKKKDCLPTNFKSIDGEGLYRDSFRTNFVPLELENKSLNKYYPNTGLRPVLGFPVWEFPEEDNSSKVFRNRKNKKDGIRKQHIPTLQNLKSSAE